MANFKILTIDGGGTRGIIPATILDLIFKETGKHPADIFSLLAGTSTGGVLCTAYADGIETSRLVELYLEKPEDIFHDTGWDDFRDGFGKNIGADYSNKKFKKILTEIFGTKTLGDIDRKLSDQEKSLMVCSFDLNPEEDGQAINFRPRIYHSNFIKDKDLSLVDLCLMTSAGPTYFPIYKNHVDGGVSLNNPSMAAVAYAINTHDDGEGEYRHPDGKRKGLGLNLSDLKVLSLGCGTSNKNYIAEKVIKSQKNGDWGNLQWVKYLPDMLTETNMQASTYYINQLLPHDRYIRIHPSFNQPDAPALIRNKVLGLDIKERKYLQAMHQYAIDIFAREKQRLYEFLDIGY